MIHRIMKNNRIIMIYAQMVRTTQVPTTKFEISGFEEWFKGKVI